MYVDAPYSQTPGRPQKSRIEFLDIRDNSCTTSLPSLILLVLAISESEMQTTVYNTFDAFTPNYGLQRVHPISSIDFAL